MDKEIHVQVAGEEMSVLFNFGAFWMLEATHGLAPADAASLMGRGSARTVAQVLHCGLEGARLRKGDRARAWTLDEVKSLLGKEGVRYGDLIAPLSDAMARGASSRSEEAPVGEGKAGSP